MADHLLADDLMTHAALVGEKHNTIIPKVYLYATGGDFVASVVLSAIAFWSEIKHSKDEGGFFYKIEQEWIDEFFVNRRQVIRAIEKLNKIANGIVLPGDDEMDEQERVALIERDLIEVKVTKPRTRHGNILAHNATHYRVNRKKYSRFVRYFAARYLRSDDSDAQNGTKCSSQNDKSENDTKCNSENDTNRRFRNDTKCSSLTYADDTADRTTHDSPPDPQGDESTGNASHLAMEEGTGASGRSTLGERFERFYTAYPKKKGKQAARRAWNRIKPDEELTTRMIAAVRAQAQSRDWQKAAGQFIPYPATWLNAGSWDDELEVASTSPAPSGERVREAIREATRGFSATALLGETHLPVTRAQGERLEAGEPVESVLSPEQIELARTALRKASKARQMFNAAGTVF